MSSKRLVFWIGGSAFIPYGVTRAVAKLKAMRAKPSPAMPLSRPDRKDARAA
jgi:hypothetical protein